MELNISSWKEFTLDELFTFKKGKRLTKADMVPGTLNYLGAISDNNGVRDHIEADRTWDGNCITVNYNGSVGEAFYQKEPFWPSDDVNCLYAKGWTMTEQIGLFLCTVIKANKFRFSYGRKWTMEKMKESLIRLPVDEIGRPNWQFMQKFIDDIQNRERESSISLRQSLATANSLSARGRSISTSCWRLYKLKDLFRIKYGINMELVTCEQEGGTINFVARTAENNGVVAKVCPVEGKTPQPAGLITIAGGGSVLSTFLQREPFYSGRDLYILDSLEPMDDYAKLFITTLIRKEKYKFSYGRQANKSIPDIEIKLPQLDNGRPDYVFMSSLIKTLPYADRL